MPCEQSSIGVRCLSMLCKQRLNDGPLRVWIKAFHILGKGFVGHKALLVGFSG